MKRARDPMLIRQAMKARGDLSQHELARLAETTQGTISFILTGRLTSPQIATRIARSLKSRVDDLFENVVTSGEQGDDQDEAAA